MLHSNAPNLSSQVFLPKKTFVICAIVLAAVVAIDLLFFAKGESFAREGGGLETMSAVFYMVAALVFFAVTPKRHWKNLWHIPALMIFFALRELDFDKAFTTSGVLSSNLYRGDSPLMTKLIAGSVLLLFLLVLFRLVRFGGPATLRGLKARASWALLAITAALTMIFSKSIDGLARKMLSFDVVVSERVGDFAGLVEEIGEAFIPIFIILAILSRWKGHTS